MKKIFLVLVCFCCFWKCKKEPIKVPVKPAVKVKIEPNDIKSVTPQEAQTFYKNPEKKYEYRTGKFNEYEYNYDVIGTDQDNNVVTGNIITHKKYGAGILYTNDKSDIPVEVEWIGYGKLIGIDSNKNEYELKIKE
ncbi:hypothetical protein ACSLMH_03615 [Flavobacterium columnare]|uniref:hypothetical protein n=1 Tax=Flavobacterium columnare TaxID=996 RepID=UPI004033BB0C